VVQKQLPNLPEKILDTLERFLADIEFSGSVLGKWPNYSKLADGCHHCHLKKGKPTYVAVWSKDKETVTVEVIYVGPHEKAPY
jgi:hypothetical protein